MKDLLDQESAAQRRWRLFYAGKLPRREAAEMQLKEDRLNSLEKARIKARNEIEYRKADTAYMKALSESGLFKIYDPRRDLRAAGVLRRLLYP